MKSGIATNPLKLKSWGELLQWDEYIQDLGYDYHLILLDEGKDIGAPELESFSKRRNKLALTLDVTRENALELLETYALHETCVCLTVGSCLSPMEDQESAEALPKIVENAVRLCGDEIWVSVENDIGVVAPLIGEYGLTSFHVNGPEIWDDLEKIEGRKAVFSKFVFDNNEKIDIAYLMCRKSFREAIERGSTPSELLKHYVIYGNKPDFKRAISLFAEKGVDLLLGCPEVLNEREAEGFINSF